MHIQKLLSLPPVMVDCFHDLEKADPGSWYCDSDPPEKKVGSGGGSAALLASAYRASGHPGPFSSWLSEAKRLLIHSGGESRRLPAYAPYGKSLIPMPVFRWSKGQYLDQKLIDFQVDYYERILSRAPESYCTLVGSGDVLFISGDRFNNLPEADVLLFGIWVEDEVASRHGVFFSHRDKPEELAFVRQKPGAEDLRTLARQYLYLMDSGIVLMNAETTMKLMRKAGWDEEKECFSGNLPAFYDLYSQMLTSFGSEAGDDDPGLKDLDVRLLALSEGEFYHFGSNRDLIDSSLKLQNRISDQRLKLARDSDHHPSIFQQHAHVDLKFGEENHHIWIENSHIPTTWSLRHHHMVTGVPENDWKIDLPAGICIDMLPLEGRQYALRVYGYEDQFKDVEGKSRTWLGADLSDWYTKRRLKVPELNGDSAASIMDLPLFPVLEASRVAEMIGFIVHGRGEPSLWTGSRRLSSRQLASAVHPRRLYSQRETFKAGNLQGLAGNHQKSIFYYLDLERAASDYRALGLELPERLNGEPSLIKQINDHMFRARVLGDNREASNHEKKAFSILREAILHPLKSEPVEPKRNVQDDQILWGRSPVRLDLAGGWTDTPPYCIMEGGRVVNLSVELNGQLPLQVYIRPIEEHKIVLRSIDLGAKDEIGSFEELAQYNQLGGVFSIPRAALVLSGFGPLFSLRHYPDLKTQLAAFGCGIEMSLLAAIPKGSGLGTSSNLAATVLGTLNRFCGLNWSLDDVAYRTLVLEQMLTTGGGWQDQYGGIFPGIKLLETQAGLVQRPSLKWLPEQLFDARETRELMLLYYTGVTRVARGILGEIVKGMFLNDKRHLDIFSEMQVHARETFDTILRNDYQELALRVAHSWELNQRLDEGTNPPEIQAITARVDDLLLGYKLLGAGGGGYLLMMAKSADAALQVRRILESDPQNPRARFVDFRVSKTGFQVSSS